MFSVTTEACKWTYLLPRQEFLRLVKFAAVLNAAVGQKIRCRQVYKFQNIFIIAVHNVKYQKSCTKVTFQFCTYYIYQEYFKRRRGTICLYHGMRGHAVHQKLYASAIRLYSGTIDCTWVSCGCTKVSFSVESITSPPHMYWQIVTFLLIMYSWWCQFSKTTHQKIR